MAYKNKDLQREYQRNWMRERREDFFFGKVCALCGSATNLELDHIDPTLKVAHTIWSWSEPKRLAEVVKCQILCYSCHLLKSSKEKAKGSAVGASKLTEAQVLEIRDGVASGLTAKHFMLKFGRPKSTIFNVIWRKSWKHL